MPELPEVETVKACLVDKVTGKRIERVTIKKGSRLLRDTVGARAFKRRIEGDTVTGLARRGKYLLVMLDGDDHLVVHLGMTGKLFTIGPAEKSPPHTHLRFDLGDVHMVLVDARTFGRVLLAPAADPEAIPALARLGPEPLGDDFTTEWLQKALAGRTASIKALLLGQALVAGVGNIYADEACFAANIHPERPAGGLSRGELERLRLAIREVLSISIECKGTTIRDYQWDQGRSGEFATRLQVYGRQGEACPACGETISKTVAAGRSTFFCARCQKGPGDQAR